MESEQRVYFVPYSWWRDAQDSVDEGNNSKGVLCVASPTPSSSYGGPMKLINTIFNSDLAFNLFRKEDDASDDMTVSTRDYALVPGDMWVQALIWHSHPKSLVKDDRCFSAAQDDKTDVYPLQLKLSVPREPNSLGVKISKKYRRSQN